MTYNHNNNKEEEKVKLEKKRYIIILILQMTKLSHREVKEKTQACTIRNQKDQNSKARVGLHTKS